MLAPKFSVLDPVILSLADHREESLWGIAFLSLCTNPKFVRSLPGFLHQFGKHARIKKFLARLRPLSPEYTNALDSLMHACKPHTVHVPLATQLVTHELLDVLVALLHQLPSVRHPVEIEAGHGLLSACLNLALMHSKNADLLMMRSCQTDPPLEKPLFQPTIEKTAFELLTDFELGNTMLLCHPSGETTINVAVTACDSQIWHIIYIGPPPGPEQPRISNFINTLRYKRFYVNCFEFKGISLHDGMVPKGAPRKQKSVVLVFSRCWVDPRHAL